MIRLFSLILSILVGTIYAQKITDILILKDGRSIKGEIIERNPDGIVVVRLPDGSKIWFYQHEILKSEKAGSAEPSRREPISSKYNLFKPIPKSDLQPMESEMLVATVSPRVVDSGHSILGGVFGMGFDPSKKPDLGRPRALETIDSSIFLKIGLTRFTELALNLEGNLKEFFYVFPEYVECSIQAKLKIALNSSPDDLFQFAIQPFVGFGTSTGLDGGIGIPAEIHFKNKIKLNANVTLFAASTGDPDSAVTNFPSLNSDGEPDGNFSIEYKSIFYLKFSHSVLVRWIALPNFNLFAEYLGYFDNVKEVLFQAPASYCGETTTGMELTFKKNLQMTLVLKLGFFDTPSRIGGAIGMAVRF